MKKLILISSLVSLILPAVAFAQETGNWNGWMGNLINGTAIVPQADLVKLIFTIIQYVLAFLGVVAVVVILIGGFMWMTAGGNEEKVGKAKKTLIQGLIGLVIILLAYAIAAFVIAQLKIFSS